MAQQLTTEVQAPLLTGANLPMLLKALTYRAEAPAALAQRVLEGARAAITAVEPAAAAHA